jgi:hypothetical protein
MSNACHGLCTTFGPEHFFVANDVEAKEIAVTNLACMRIFGTLCARPRVWEEPRQRFSSRSHEKKSEWWGLGVKLLGSMATLQLCNGQALLSIDL